MTVWVMVLVICSTWGASGSWGKSCTSERQPEVYRTESACKKAVPKIGATNIQRGDAIYMGIIDAAECRPVQVVE